jgi:hypothetical protein
MSLPTSNETPRVTGRKRDTVIWLDKRILTFSRHWTTFIGVLVGIYAGLPFLAPVAMHYKQTAVANVIYTVYSPVCHQFAFRSWFLYGEQAAYPRAIAGAPGETFEEAAANDPAFSGIDLETLNTPLVYAAKAFRGNEQLGWKVAFCERDVAIYVALALRVCAAATPQGQGAVPAVLGICADRHRADRDRWVQPAVCQPAFQRLRSGLLPDP